MFIVGGADTKVLEWNRDVIARVGSRVKRMEIVEGASHLFEEKGALQKVARVAGEFLAEWFGKEEDEKEEEVVEADEKEQEEGKGEKEEKRVREE